jgi:PAS domain S-box-containing protein
VTAGIEDPLVFRQVMETLIEQVDDGVLVADAGGRVLYHNAAARALFGLAPGAELHELRQLGAFRWNRRGRSSADRDGAPAGERIQRYEERVAVGESQRYLAFTVRRVGLAAGRSEVRVLVVRDVTRQRQIEATLEESRACGLITANAEMINLIERAKQVARSDAAVLLQGESGVGKTCFARLIHEHSGRAHAPLVEVNCAAIPEALLEAEFFGTGRPGESRNGKFSAAQGGTLFLDEIGEIPVHIQARLLTVLEEQRFRRPGGGEMVRVDARIISAGNADLRRAVDAGRFRPELYYRIAVIPLRIPPLRERIGDIPVLVRHFCDNLLARTRADDIRIAREAWQALLNYPWPGNIRELANAVEHGFICAEQGEVKLDSLPQDVRLYSQEPAPAPAAVGEGKGADAAGGQDELLSALRRAHGSKAVAAKLLGIDRTTLWRRMQRMRMS